MKKILIAGLGNIGKRYLEGILKIDFPIDILIYDIKKELTQKYIKEINDTINKSKLHNVKFFNFSDKLSKKIDLLIVSTTSDVRYETLNLFIKNFQIKNIILEKIVFKNKNEYLETSKISNFSKIYLNQGLRYHPDYNAIKDNIDSSKRVDLFVKGSNWGLACNAVHILDYFMDITKSFDVSFADTSSLIVKQSKRSGFVEFVGTIKGMNNKGDTFSISCTEDLNQELKFQQIEIHNDSNYYCTDSSNRTIKYVLNKDGTKEKKLKTHYISDYSTELICDIFLSKNICLPEFNDYCKFNINYLSFFKVQLSRIYPNKDWSNVPIT